MKGDSEELLDSFSPLFRPLSKSYDFMKFKETMVSLIYYNKLYFFKIIANSFIFAIYMLYYTLGFYRFNCRTLNRLLLNLKNRIS